MFHFELRRAMFGAFRLEQQRAIADGRAMM